MISTPTKVNELETPSKREARELITACLLESGFVQHPEELRREVGESVVFLNGTVQHYKDYSSWAECSRDLSFWAQAMILIASGAILQEIGTKYKL